MSLSVTIVISTDGRRAKLATTLNSLRHLDSFSFEVCVVSGPTPDGTRELLASWPDPIKHVSVEVLNLSVSRNRGIDQAAGDVVAFLDDDAIPEAEWLNQILAGYSDGVGGVGGFVFDHTGLNYQWRYGTTDRLGRADLGWSRPATEYNFPHSYNFPHLLGANSTFRREALVAVGGFDEEFDYFLDETDLAARIIDAGWSIVQLAGAHVHHKPAASHLRIEARFLRSWFPILKNKLYYGLMHRHGYHSVRDVMQEFERYSQGHRDTCAWAVSAGHLTPPYQQSFESDFERAMEQGLIRGLSGVRKLMSAERRIIRPPQFVQYRRARWPKDRKRFCLLTQEYPPGVVGGTARYMHQIATGMAALGHDVHVITMTTDQPRVDFEDGVWVHRLVPGYSPGHPAKETSRAELSNETPTGPIPEAIWRSCATRLSYIAWLSERKHIDCVYSLIWDCEGAAILRDGRFPIVVGLQTTLAFWLDNNPERQQDRDFMATFGLPMLALEAQMLSDCTAIHAISRNILRDIENQYSLSIAPKARVIPLGFDDLRSLPFTAAPQAQAGTRMRLLFVGRLETRKGIDVLLKIAPNILRRFEKVQIDIVGDDKLPGPGGVPYRDAFERLDLPDEIARRVVFHGKIDGDRLRGFYRSCDVFVAPSRYESFGIIFVEAMMFSKPVVGCRAGGMPEIIEEGVTGLMAAPGDADSLYQCLTTLLSNEELRSRMGRAGRQCYEVHFTKERMVRDVAALMLAASREQRRDGTTLPSPMSGLP
jgi:glycosyltransferase involved in cell wall biosynthesis/GT2 family glycosyltransferase